MDLTKNQPEASKGTEQVVKIQLADGGMTIVPETVQLENGDVVVWHLPAFDESQSYSLFFPDGGAQGLGPFSCLHRSPGLIRGEGNLGKPGSFGYQVLVEAAGSSALVAGTGTIENAADLKNSTPKVEIFADLAEGTFEVLPRDVALYPNGVVEFEFHGLQADSMPFLRFGPYRSENGEIGESGHFGPFTALEQVANRILGHGFDGRIGSFHYGIEVAVATQGGAQRRRLESSQDPVLDRLPYPIDP